MDFENGLRGRDAANLPIAHLAGLGITRFPIEIKRSILLLFVRHCSTDTCLISFRALQPTVQPDNLFINYFMFLITGSLTKGTSNQTGNRTLQYYV